MCMEGDHRGHQYSLQVSMSCSHQSECNYRVPTSLIVMTMHVMLVYVFHSFSDMQCTHILSYHAACICDNCWLASRMLAGSGLGMKLH